MDSNTLVHPDHRAEIDKIGNILLWLAILPEVDTRLADSQTIITQLIEAALANARSEMDGLIMRVAMSPAMSVVGNSLLSAD